MIRALPGSCKDEPGSAIILEPLDIHATVHAQTLAGDGSGIVRSQEDAGGADFFWPAGARNGDHLDDRIERKFSDAVARCICGVSTRDGRIVFTVIPCEAYSRARPLVMPMTPPFEPADQIPPTADSRVQSLHSIRIAGFTIAGHASEVAAQRVRTSPKTIVAEFERNLLVEWTQAGLSRENSGQDSRKWFAADARRRIRRHAGQRVWGQSLAEPARHMKSGIKVSQCRELGTDPPISNRGDSVQLPRKASGILRETAPK